MSSRQDEAPLAGLAAHKATEGQQTRMSTHTGDKRSLPTAHRHTFPLHKTEILVNVYDLLPPGRLSSILWGVGASLLHSAVVVNGREYAYGGHDNPGVTGVYWTRPRNEPPGATFRCELLQGFSLAAAEETDAILRQMSDDFLGTAYNVLSRNCNHFTSELCRRLTGKPGPAWLNRAASIAVALPCVVQPDWVLPPAANDDECELVEPGTVDDGNPTVVPPLGRSQEQERMLGRRASAVTLLGGPEGWERIEDGDERTAEY